MSGEDDTFDIDIYGDEDQEQHPGDDHDHDHNHSYAEDDLNFGDDGGNYDFDGQQGQQDHTQQGDGMNEEQTTEVKKETQHRPQPQQGTKRKAEDDISQQDHKMSHRQQSTEPAATLALKLSDLHWWTTEEDLRRFCATAHVEGQLVDLSFGEHKINGKSRGEAYLEFSSPAAASAAKREIERREEAQEGQTEGKRVHPFHVHYSPVGNPFKGRDSGAQGKKDGGGGQGAVHGGGAYNPNFSRGGGFHRGGSFNRGGAGFNRGGGPGFNRGGGFPGAMNNQGGGWNAGGMGAGGFGPGNPMMGMGMGMPMNMGGYNMGSGGGMMGRGGFGGGMGGMGGMGMGMGNARGGMGMGARGGWNNGFPSGGMAQGGYGGGGGGYRMGMQGPGGPNKRMKPDG